MIGTGSKKSQKFKYIRDANLFRYYFYMSNKKKGFIQMYNLIVMLYQFFNHILNEGILTYVPVFAWNIQTNGTQGGQVVSEFKLGQME